MCTTVCKHSKFISLIPHPSHQHGLQAHRYTTSVHGGSVVWVWGHYYTITVCLVLLLLKNPPITPRSTYLEYLSLGHFQNWSKISSGICPGKSLSLQISHGHEKTWTVRTRLLQILSGEWAFEEGPLPPAVGWKRETAAMQMLPWASFLTRVDGREMQERDFFVLHHVPPWGGAAEEAKKGLPHLSCPGSPGNIYIPWGLAHNPLPKPCWPQISPPRGKTREMLSAI